MPRSSRQCGAASSARAAHYAGPQRLPAKPLGPSQPHQEAMERLAVMPRHRRTDAGKPVSSPPMGLGRRRDCLLYSSPEGRLTPPGSTIPLQQLRQPAKRVCTGSHPSPPGLPQTH
ncbi:hypothetical protein NDU88_005183 [Pleurodeles waltl]|uniref:Uncharacterized protein n=1 Tax=Pleurodeles waltl TaxID=8319 RepID=A0AAV7T9Q9_PLEWA|nr:hypothetical protein NDU88_005183 [Pleurodeles waltl]